MLKKIKIFITKYNVIPNIIIYAIATMLGCLVYTLLFNKVLYQILSK